MGGRVDGRRASGRMSKRVSGLTKNGASGEGGRRTGERAGGRVN